MYSCLSENVIVIRSFREMSRNVNIKKNIIVHIIHVRLSIVSSDGGIINFFIVFYRRNRPRSIYQYSNMVPRLSGQTAILGVVFFVPKALLGIETQKKL